MSINISFILPSQIENLQQKNMQKNASENYAKENNVKNKIKKKKYNRSFSTLKTQSNGTE